MSERLELAEKQMWGALALLKQDILNKFKKKVEAIFKEESERLLCGEVKTPEMFIVQVMRRIEALKLEDLDG